MQEKKQGYSLDSSPTNETEPKGFTTLITDFSKVLINPKDENHRLYNGSLNKFHQALQKELGSKYNILDFFEINQELLNEYVKLKSNGIRVIIYTSETIQEDPKLWPILSEAFNQGDIYSAMRLGIDKSDTNGYQTLLEVLGLASGQVVFIDDSAINIQAATEAGIKTVHFISNDKAIEKLNVLFDIENNS